MDWPAGRLKLLAGSSNVTGVWRQVIASRPLVAGMLPGLEDIDGDYSCHSPRTSLNALSPDVCP
jgi:hypothetical protein